MGFHRSVAIFFLVVLVSQFLEFSTAEYPVSSPDPVQTFDDQHQIVIQPSSLVPNGETYVQGVILPNATVTILVDFKNVINASFVILQAHSYISPLQLSSAVPPKEGNYVNGTDIGLYSKLIPLIHTIVYYISNPHNVTVDVLLVPVFYSKEDPVPGGCNLSFPVSVAPFMTLSYDRNNSIVQVDAQAASAQEQTDCQPIGLSYEVYEIHTSNITAEGYFDAILSVITPEKAAFKGLSSLKPAHQPELRRRFATYPGFGSIYVVTVRNVKTGKSSAYVPISNYNCVDRNDGSCPYNQNSVLIFWTIVVISTMFICTEIHYIVSRDQLFVLFKRSLFVVGSTIILSSLLPTMLGNAFIFIVCVGTGASFCTRERDFVGCLQPALFIIDEMYALVPAHVLFVILFNAGLNLLPCFQGWASALSLFLAFVLFFYASCKLYPGHSFNQCCGLFFILMVVSYATHGIILNAYVDLSRILAYEFSDVMFNLPTIWSDQIALIVWCVILMTYEWCMRVTLRARYSRVEYQEINNDPPLLNSQPMYMTA